MQGHRGARAVLPENTLAAFRHALEAGVDVLELDLHITKDDVLVVAHDPRVPAWCTSSRKEDARATEGTPLRTLTLAQVKELDCGSIVNPRFPKQRAVPGEKMATLEEVLALAVVPRAGGKSAVRFNIETKSVPGDVELTAPPARFAALVVEAIDRAKLRSRVSVQSFDHRVLREVKKLADDIVLVALVDESLPDLVAVARAAQADIVSPSFNWLTADDVTRLHEAKLRVVVWTVNEPKDWARMIAMGVDGIITDDPAALMAWLTRHPRQ